MIRRAPYLLACDVDDLQASLGELEGILKQLLSAERGERGAATSSSSAGGTPSQHVHHDTATVDLPSAPKLIVDIPELLLQPPLETAHLVASLQAYGVDVAAIVAKHPQALLVHAQDATRLLQFLEFEAGLGKKLTAALVSTYKILITLNPETQLRPLLVFLRGTLQLDPAHEKCHGKGDDAAQILLSFQSYSLCSPPPIHLLPQSLPPPPFPPTHQVSTLGLTQRNTSAVPLHFSVATAVIVAVVATMTVPVTVVVCISTPRRSAVAILCFSPTRTTSGWSPGCCSFAALAMRWIGRR